MTKDLVLLLSAISFGVSLVGLATVQVLLSRATRKKRRVLLRRLQEMLDYQGSKYRELK